jgi:uncharacterized protein (TIGR02001 family)
MGRIVRREHERRLRIVEFQSDRLHLGARESFGVQHDRHRIAAEHLVGEHIGGGVTSLHECWHVGTKGAILPRIFRGEPTTGVESLTAMFDNRDASVYPLGGVVALSIILLSASPLCKATDAWGGSIDLTSDYFLRGISLSDDQPALQLDLHYVNPSGFVAGLFASSAQIDPAARRDAELSAFLGYVWSYGEDWQGKILAADYRYPWNQAGSVYNYDEIDLEIAYQQWIRVALAVYPNVQRYTLQGSVVTVLAQSAELSLQRPVVGKLSANAGIGYYELDGSGGSGYAYWSVGATYDWTPVILGLSYVEASRAANLLYYNAAVGGRWSGTIIWRF